MRILTCPVIILIYASLSSGGERIPSFGSQFLPSGNYEHVILTPAIYKDTFQILANLRTRCGIPSRVFCIESTMVYPGRDPAEKMRNFLRDADTTWGLNFAFIARQDHPARQYRYCWGNTATVRDTIPCDMYFSDLHRRGINDPFYDWDANRNNIFGEIGDSIDYWSDIHVGMITIDNATQASTYLHKLLNHERNPDSLYFAKILLVGTGSESYLNLIADTLPVPPWKIDKMYANGQGNELPSAAKFRDSVNAGFSYSAIIGHGATNSMGIPDNYTATHVSQQTNYNRLNTLMTVCSYCGAFEQADNCLAETMVVARGGFINVVVNARYGWIGINEQFLCQFFFKSLPPPLSARKYIGQVVSEIKDYFISRYPRPGQADSSRWLYQAYGINLFGDPAVMMHNWSPLRTMTVTHESQIRIGPQNYTVYVSVDGAPLESVLVCLWKGTEVYARGYTNAGGSVTLFINPLTIGVMLLTCTRRNHFTYEGSGNVVGIEEDAQRLTLNAQHLLTVYPNPLRCKATIKFSIGQRAKDVGQGFNLAIYDASGRLVKQFKHLSASGGIQPFNQIVWDGKDDEGIDCVSGIYFCYLKAGGFTKIKTLIKLR